MGDTCQGSFDTHRAGMSAGRSSSLAKSTLPDGGIYLAVQKDPDEQIVCQWSELRHHLDRMHEGCCLPPPIELEYQTFMPACQ